MSEQTIIPSAPPPSIYPTLDAKRILYRELNEFSSFLVSKYALGEA